MTTTEAIARSSSHNEIVRVTVKDIDTAVTEINAAADYCDYCTTDNGTDVWGDLDGKEFRLLLVQA